MCAKCDKGWAKVGNSKFFLRNSRFCLRNSRIAQILPRFFTFKCYSCAIAYYSADFVPSS